MGKAQARAAGGALAILLFLVLACSAPRGAPGKESVGSLDALLDTAGQALRAGDLDRAEGGYREALKRFRLLPDAYLGLARVQHQRGQVAEAITTLGEGLSLDRTYTEALLAQATYRAELGETPLAINTLEELLWFDPFNAEAEHELARHLVTFGQPFLARIHQERAYILAPNRFAGDYQAARAPLALADTSSVERAAWREAGSIDALIRGLGGSLRAIRLLDKAFAPGQAVSSRAEFESALLSNRYDQVTAPLLASLYRGRALEYLARRQVDSAFAEYTMALSRVAEAEETFRQLAAIESSPEGAAFFLRRALQIGGRVDSLLEKLQSVQPAAVPLDLRPSREQRRECVQSSQGAWQQGDTARAVAVLEACIEADPSIEPPYPVLGALYQQRGDADRALLFLRRSVEMSPDAWLNYVSLANALFRAGRRAEAITLARFALTHSTDAKATALLRDNLALYGR